MKYVSYLRLSKETKGGWGIDAQRHSIKHFYPEIEREFVEIKSGATISERPILQEAIAYCLEHDTTLVIAKVDRLTRDVDDGRAVLRSLNGRIRFCDIPGEPDEFILTLIFALAERERKMIGLRVQAGLKARKATGLPLGTNIPQCAENLASIEYKKRGGQAMKTKADEDVENRKAYSLAAELRKNGLTYDQVAGKLASAGFTSAKGKPLGKSSIFALIKRFDPVFAGKNQAATHR